MDMYQLQHIDRTNTDHVQAHDWHASAPVSKDIFDLIITQIDQYHMNTETDDIVKSADGYMVALREYIAVHTHDTVLSAKLTVKEGGIGSEIALDLPLTQNT